MAGKLRVCFNSPQSGFMSVGLRAGAREFATAVACRPYDSLRDLIVGLTALARGENVPVVVRWNCEPEELDFRFTPEGGRVRFEVVRYATHRRAEAKSRTVFAASGTRAVVCGAFFNALRDLQADAETDEFASNWRREFPEREVRELTRAVEAARDSSTTDGN